MHCIKCGRNIPENTVFCTGCAAPPAQVASVQLPVKTNRSARPEPAKKKKPRTRRELRHTVRGLAVSTAVLSLLLIAAGAAAYSQSRTLQERREDLRIREAGVILREKEADNRDAQIRELEAQLNQAKTELQYTQDALAQEQATVAQLQTILGITVAPETP